MDTKKFPWKTIFKIIAAIATAIATALGANAAATMF